MILRVRAQTFTIDRKEARDFQTFTDRYAIARLIENLETARQELTRLPENGRRRQREKIKRLEARLDKAQLSLAGIG